jgi:predicted RNA-binding Zn-ribbon protein involved in translation (DUF1610 family)
MNKQALYFYDVKNLYRPSQQEYQSKTFSCPKCRNILSRPRYSVLTEIYNCPSCGFSIEMKQILRREDVSEAIKRKNERLTENNGELIIRDIIANKQ